AEVVSTTNSSGRYQVRGLPQGLYSITIDASGFKRTNVSGVTVTAGRTVNNNVALEVGQVSETVSVAANEVNALPINGRNINNLARLSPGAAMKSEDSGVEADVETQDIGELFEYKIARPVTIKRNSSALIPILQNQIEGESVSLYNQK